LLAVFALAIWGYTSAASSAVLTEEGVLQLQYKEGMQRTMPSFNKNYGKYLGSGTGTISGKLNGSAVWDLYEEQSDPKLHRTQFVGRITSSHGSTVSFETSGYFIPRESDGHHWDLTSAIYFTDAKDAAYQSLSGKIGLLQGDVDVRTYSHTYRLYIPGP
jgi:hypothetical protein